MKQLIIIFIVLSGLLFASCNEFLTPEPYATERLSSYFRDDTAAISSVNSAYVPLQWQLAGTYCNEWFVGDVVSDDALKGGASISDMQVVLLMENFQTTANNLYLESFYNINYQGIFRCNFAMENIIGMDDEKLSSPELKRRLIAEAKFLRALYHFRLIRIFGGVIKGDRTYNQLDALKAKSTKAEIVEFIRSDLDAAIKDLPLKNEYASTELGRATKSAAQALLMRVILFDIKNSENTTGDYDRVIALGDSIIKSTQYTLKSNYADIFKVFFSPNDARFIEENGSESVFEVQYMAEATSDYGGVGRTRGNFDPIMTRTRAGNHGWGFNRPSQDLYDAFESGDPRRDEAILPFNAGDVYGPGEYDNGFHARKASLGFWRTVSGNLTYYMPPLQHATRAPNNTMMIRYADVILMYAEAACERNNLPEGLEKLNWIRKRAKDSSADPLNPAILPPFPYGNYGNNQADLRKAIRHERRVELAMEGHRWFDLIRWGIAGEVMNAYRIKYADKEGKDMSPFIVGKHELFPIPETQLNANPLLEQNPDY